MATSDNIELSLVYDRKVITTIFDYVDPTIEDFFDAFEGILIAYGFSCDTIKDFYFEKVSQIKEKNNEAVNRRNANSN